MGLAGALLEWCVTWGVWHRGPGLVSDRGSSMAQRGVLAQVNASRPAHGGVCAGRVMGAARGGDDRPGFGVDQVSIADRCHPFWASALSGRGRPSTMNIGSVMLAGVPLLLGCRTTAHPMNRCLVWPPSACSKRPMR